MPDTTNNLPEQIIEASKAFTQTLEMENAVFQAQLSNSVDMTINAFKELLALCKDAVVIGSVNTEQHQSLTNSMLKILSDVQNAASPNTAASPALPETSPSSTITGAVVDSAVLHAVGLSYNNAVSAQQQANTLQQAAAAQIISTIISVATATLSGPAAENLN